MRGGTLRQSVGARVSRVCVVRPPGAPHVAAAAAAEARRRAEPPRFGLAALLRRLSSTGVVRCPDPRHLLGLLPGQTRTPNGSVLSGPTPGRPQPALRQCWNESGSFQNSTFL